MTSSLICINLSLRADWSRAGETEAARAFHPFQCSLSLSPAECVRVRALIAKRRFILCCQETRISFIAGRQSVSSKQSQSELLSTGFYLNNCCRFLSIHSTDHRLPAFRLEKREETRVPTGRCWRKSALDSVRIYPRNKRRFIKSVFLCVGMKE